RAHVEPALDEDEIRELFGHALGAEIPREEIHVIARPTEPDLEALAAAPGVVGDPLIDALVLFRDDRLEPVRGVGRFAAVFLGVFSRRCRRIVTIRAGACRAHLLELLPERRDAWPG